MCESIASLLGRPVERVAEGGTAASKGVALMTGLIKGLVHNLVLNENYVKFLGYWTEDEMQSKVSLDTVFVPDSDLRQTLLSTFSKWEKAVDRCSKFYD